MKLSDLTLPVSMQDATTLAMIFSPQLAARLSELWTLHGTNKLRPWPMPLVDGRYMLRADLLLEIGPGGLLHAMWEAADKAILLSQVDVVPMEEALAMRPPDPPIPN